MLHSRFIAATIITLLFTLSACTGTQTHDANRPIMELNTDRPGSDINSFPLDKPQPKLCSDACNANTGCVAWTYVKPGIINAKAHCRIKDDIPEPERSSCCISGVKKDKSE